MSSFAMFIVLLYMISTAGASALLSSTPTVSPWFSNSRALHGPTTPPPSLPSGFELRKRKANRGRTCGWSFWPNGDWDYWVVSSPYYCAATILPNGSAYAYSSDAEVGEQYSAITAAVGNWDNKKSCPTSTTCCSGNNNIVQTYLFIGGQYTVTSLWCGSTHLTKTWIPQTNLLQTKDFSISLARATASAAASNSGGLSSQTEIGIGVGVAGGVAVVLLAGIAFFFWRRRQKRKERFAEGDPKMPYSVSAHYDPRGPANPATWYGDSGFEYYPKQTDQSAWPAPPPEAVRLQELQGHSQFQEWQELPGQPKTGAVLEQQRGWPRQELSADP